MKQSMSPIRDLKSIPFRLARAYLEGVKSGLDPDTVSLIEGALRGRHLKVLTHLWKPDVDALHSTLFYTRHLRQIEAFFKKYDALSDGAACESAALAAFFEGERRCRVTNKRLTHYYLHPDRLDPLIGELVDDVRRIIRRQLGSVESFLNSIPQDIGITGGATASNSRLECHPLLKLAEHRPQGNPQFEPLYRALCAATGIEPEQFSPQLWNRVEFVLKNWKTKRTIACEPAFMMPVQLAFDRHCKRKLRRMGVTLADQSRNQELARVGSILGDFVTVDLKGASDSEALNLVHYAFPDDWASLLCRLRSPYGKLPNGQLVKYEKFASMGNGCTFPIESLTFAACCVAVNRLKGHSTFRVYGDDIIIHRDCVDVLLRLLSFLGFVPNVDKTFVDGPFRESCGGDYWLGEEVTPFYLRSFSKRTDVSLLLNAMREFPSSPGMDSLFSEFMAEYRIPLVPPSEDLTSGFQISVSECYNRGVFSRKGRAAREWQVPSYYRLHLNRCDGLDRGKRIKLSRRALALQRRITYYSRSAPGSLLWHIHATRVDEETIKADATPLVTTTQFKVTLKRAVLRLVDVSSQQVAYLGDLLLCRTMPH